MSSIIRVRGKRRNREQYAAELAERCKRARLSRVHDKQDETERALSRLERLPLELLELIFTHSRNLSLLNVSRHMRYLLDRETFINKFIVRLFQETGVYDDNDISLFHDSSGAASCLNVFLLYPCFDSSFILRYTRNLLLDRVNIILGEWIKDQSCIPAEDLSNHLKSLEYQFDIVFGLVDITGVKPRHGTNGMLGYFHEEASKHIRHYDYELAGDHETIRITPGLTSFSVYRIAHTDDAAPVVSPSHDVSIYLRPLKPDMWTNLMPQAFFRAPFTQSKGDYLRLMLDMCPESLMNECARDPLNQLSDGFADALELGCGPAMYCIGTRIPDFMRIEWDPVAESKPERGLSTVDAVTGPQADSKGHVDGPWQYLIGASGNSKQKQLTIDVEGKHIVACLKGFRLFPDVYLDILDAFVPQRLDKLDNEISALMYTVAQKQEPQMKAKLLSRWKRWVGYAGIS